MQTPHICMSGYSSSMGRMNYKIVYNKNRKLVVYCCYRSAIRLVGTKLSCAMWVFANFIPLFAQETFGMPPFA